MVGELESIPESHGHNRTLLWLRPYEKLDRSLAEMYASVGYYDMNKYIPSYENLDFFLQQAKYPPTIKHRTNANGSLEVSAFQLSILMKGLSEWSYRAQVEEKCRQILEKFPQYNTTLFDGDSPVLGMLLTVKLDLVGSIAVTVACMTVICSLFIPHPLGVAIVAFTVSSISFTLVGLISWWGADMDPVTLVDCLMAVGFSVDYTAHIAHQFYVKEGSAEERIRLSLLEMAGPMMQAGVSTLLCMCPLIFVPTYAIVAFAKTIFGVVGLGILHGILLMPVLLCMCPTELKCTSASTRRNHTEPKELVESNQPFLSAQT
ncbi:Patched family protein [Aphelenchoides avenae]|nr:Patched family protein [Aphelenchus avenae]